MVHYDANPAARVPPILCPKCGSHRTEVVGRTPDDSRYVIRCNACGERSDVPNPENAGTAASAETSTLEA